MIKEIESNAGTLGVNKMVPEHTQAMVEIEKPVKATPELESPAPPGKRKGKAPPTLVTLESLLIESPIQSPSPTRFKKQKGATGATKNPQITQKQPPAADKKDGKKTNPRDKLKANGKEAESPNPKAANIPNPKAANGPNPKALNKNKDKNNDKIKQEKQTGKPTIPQDSKSPEDKTPRNKENQKPPKNFIAKNAKSFKPKPEDVDDDDTISSYLSRYQKRQPNTIPEDNSVDGHLSIPSNVGKPNKLVGGSYHANDLKLENVYGKDNKYLYDFDFLSGNDDDTPQVTPEPEPTNKKCYKAIYARRKDDKEAIQKLWATSVKDK